MSLVLSYGAGRSLAIELPTAGRCVHLPGPAGHSPRRLASAVGDALAAPLGFPPLAQATVPGDRVAIAVDEATPHAAIVAAAVVSTLVEGPVEPDDVTIILPPDARPALADEIAEQLPESCRQRVRIVVHDPRQTDSLAYLAASEAAEPIYLHRALCDADFIVPIATLRLDDALGYVGLHGGVFPVLADQRSRERFLASPPTGADERRRRRREADEAAYLAGILFTVQLAPAAAGRVLDVLAGDPRTVSARGAAVCEAAWRFELEEPADLVLAVLSGGPDEQTWENFARSLAAALAAVADGGAVAIISDVAEPLGPALRRLRGGGSPPAILRAVQRTASSDAPAAALLLQALERGPVYVRTARASEEIEELGVTPLASDDEAARLVRASRSCLVLENAQHALPQRLAAPTS